jgi:hypothetical protein
MYIYIYIYMYIYMYIHIYIYMYIYISVVGSTDSMNADSPDQYKVEILPKPILSAGFTQQNEQSFDQQQYTLLPFLKEELESLHSILTPPDNHKHKDSQIDGIHKKIVLLPIMTTVKANIQMTAATWTQDVRHIELSFDNGNETSHKIYLYYLNYL